MRNSLKRMLGWLVTGALLVSMGVSALAVSPQAVKPERFPENIVSLFNAMITSSTPCQHAWEVTMIGSKRQEWDASEGCFHWYQDAINVCIRCGDYFYSTIDLGRA